MVAQHSTHHIPNGSKKNLPCSPCTSNECGPCMLLALTMMLLYQHPALRNMRDCLHGSSCFCCPCRNRAYFLCMAHMKNKSTCFFSRDAWRGSAQYRLFTYVCRDSHKCHAEWYSWFCSNNKKITATT